MIAKHVEMQKKIVGGRFAVARAVRTRKVRDRIREILPDCIFVILTMDIEVVKKRLTGPADQGGPWVPGPPWILRFIKQKKNLKKNLTGFLRGTTLT